MTWSPENAQCNESKKIVWEVAEYLKGRGLDIGAGDFKVLPHVISVDNFHHQAFGFMVKPDVMAEADDLSMFADRSMDFVYSSHTLEHVVDFRKVLREWWRLVKVHGYLVLYLPHKNLYPNIGQPGSNPDHKHDFLPIDIVNAMPSGYDLLECQERGEADEYSFLLVFRKVEGNKRIRSCDKPKPEKTACVVRYGAFGDLMQSSSVWAGLKKQGYHVTVITSMPGAEVILEDPNIDKFMIFDRDQVPNADLGSFWKWQKKKFDVFINLSETVEGAFLSMVGRASHAWKPLVRHSMQNRNYVEFQHEMAGLPHEPRVKFYPTAEERKWAKEGRAKLGPGPVVMWSLAGSSPHKTWPYLDQAMASILMNFPTSRIVLVGGPECQLLEGGWEEEKRVIRTCGAWSIRKSLAFLEVADMVIGPETGVLNAAAQLPLPKVVFLSHSTHENLTRDWVNVHPLISESTECPGRGNNEAPACHMLHHTWEFCKMDKETSCAQCQADIGMAQAWPVIEKALHDYVN